MTGADTIQGLCAAIDSGDDAVLPILADALEEAGDPRAAGLRATMAEVPPFVPGLYRGESWWRCNNRWDYPAFVPSRLFAHLAGGRTVVEIDEDTGDPFVSYRFYATRSAAFLALAAALTEDANG